ncbi:hypothetical protein HUW46_06933 [Amycolatopsis sp. CA-230715]|nr:hypothetical protein HUW46_06933 [Amycolatopsis sp. CA-230715]
MVNTCPRDEKRRILDECVSQRMRRAGEAFGQIAQVDTTDRYSRTE